MSGMGYGLDSAVGSHMLRSGMDEIAIRPLGPDDADAAAALITRAFSAQPVLLDPPPSALRLTGADVLAGLRAGGGAGAVAGGVLVGAVLWAEEAGGLYVSRLSVTPERRGQGIASRLLEAAEDVAQASGLPRLHLGTRLALQANRRLFARCGFREIAFHAHPGYAAPTWVEMEKRLGQAAAVA